MAGTSTSALSSRAAMSGAPVTVPVEHALDLAEVEEVRGALSVVLPAAALDPAAEVVLELSECDFVDGTGYGLLCEAAGLCHERGVALHLSGVRPEVLRILERLDRLLQGGVLEHVLGAEPRAAHAPDGDGDTTRDGAGPLRSTVPRSR